MPIPPGVLPKEKDEPIPRDEWQSLRCPRCEALLRPHVLWFDECYDDTYYHLSDSLEAARRTALLIVVGTSGATNLPSQIVARVYRQDGFIIDINPEGNPFGQLAQGYERGLAIKTKSGKALAEIVRHVQGGGAQSP